MVKPPKKPQKLSCKTSAQRPFASLHDLQNIVSTFWHLYSSHFSSDFFPNLFHKN